MNRYISVCILLIGNVWVSCPMSFGQVTLPGLLTYQNSENRPVIGAEVTALWANGAISDEEGNFSLSFTGKGPGYRTQIRVILHGYEVVNKKDLLHTLRADLRRPLKLYLCPEGQWERNAVKYYKINEEKITLRYRKELEAVKEALQSSQERLADSLNRLEELYQFALQNAQRLAEQFAIANLDDADSLYRAAFEQFTQGNIDSAINILADDLLDENMLEAQQQKADADTLLGKGEEILANAEAARKTVAQEYFLRFQGKQILHPQKANQDLRKAFRLDSSNYDIRLAFGRYLIEKQPRIARRHFHWLLEQPLDSLKQLLVWVEIAETFRQEDHIDSVVISLEKAQNLTGLPRADIYMKLMQAYQQQAWQALIQQRFSRVEKISQKVLDKTSEEVWPASYLGLSMVLQNQWSSAKNHYESLRQLPAYELHYRKVLLSDLEQLQMNGLTHSRFKRLEKTLLRD